MVPIAQLLEEINNNPTTKKIKNQLKIDISTNFVQVEGFQIPPDDII